MAKLTNSDQNFDKQTLKTFLEKLLDCRQGSTLEPQKKCFCHIQDECDVKNMMADYRV
jgi:hypothetical protein